eukprot:jgi/Bigna1/129687/aug1.9_g4395
MSWSTYFKRLKEVSDPPVEPLDPYTGNPKCYVPRDTLTAKELRAMGKRAFSTSFHLPDRASGIGDHKRPELINTTERLINELDPPVEETKRKYKPFYTAFHIKRNDDMRKYAMEHYSLRSYSYLKHCRDNKQSQKRRLTKLKKDSEKKRAAEKEAAEEAMFEEALTQRLKQLKVNALLDTFRRSPVPRLAWEGTRKEETMGTRREETIKEEAVGDDDDATTAPDDDEASESEDDVKPEGVASILSRMIDTENFTPRSKMYKTPDANDFLEAPPVTHRTQRSTHSGRQSEAQNPRSARSVRTSDNFFQTAAPLSSRTHGSNIVSSRTHGSGMVSSRTQGGGRVSRLRITNMGSTTGLRSARTRSSSRGYTGRTPRTSRTIRTSRTTISREPKARKSSLRLPQSARPLRPQSARPLRPQSARPIHRGPPISARRQQKFKKLQLSPRSRSNSAWSCETAIVEGSDSINLRESDWER